MEDLRAVFDAAGASRAVVLGAHDGCSTAALYAATYPERTRALALFHPFLHGPGIADRATQKELSAIRTGWGTQEVCDKLLEHGSPTLYAGEEDRRWFANWMRVGEPGSRLRSTGRC